jgi:hypothetical protein
VVGALASALKLSDPSKLCSVRRMTRCHHVGVAAKTVERVYWPLVDTVVDWSDIKDRALQTPSQRVPGKVDNPRVLPCIKHVTIEGDIPYYGTIPAPSRCKLLLLPPKQLS